MGLELRDVSFAYDDGDASRVIFDDVSINLDTGRVYAVTGPSGSGKTTLFRLASGELSPGSGTVLINGSPPRTLREKSAPPATTESPAAPLIAQVFQEYRLVPFLTALENVQLPHPACYSTNIPILLAGLPDGGVIAAPQRSARFPRI